MSQFADHDALYWENHTSDGRCKYPRTCEAGEGGHRDIPPGGTP